MDTVAALDVLRCHAGWRNYNFVKLTTSAGAVGWSEFDEGFGSPGVSSVIEGFAPRVVGRPVDRHERAMLDMHFATRPAQGGVVGQAMGAIENALLDAKARTLGLPCHALLGGKVRDSVRVYWSHGPTWRVVRSEHYGHRVDDLPGIIDFGHEVRDRGFTAVKTNLFRSSDGGLSGWVPGFGHPDCPGLVAESALLSDLVEQLNALRDGIGGDVDILLDLNFNLRAGGLTRVLDAVADLDLYWVEIDTESPAALAAARAKSRHQISGCETLIGPHQLLPYLQAGALDVAIVDGVWNGMWQALKLASLAAAFQVNVAPHNFYGHLSTFMNLHWAAVVPNLEIFEVDVDRVAIDDELFSTAPSFRDGHLAVPDAPGWGCEPDQSVIAANPPR